MATKNVGISEVTASDLAREASKHRVSRDKIISKMLDFFRIYGIDPFNYDAPADEMQKIIKRMDSVVAFIKKQEKTILIPTLARLASTDDYQQLRANQRILREEAVKDKEDLKQTILEQARTIEGLKRQLEEERKSAKNQRQAIVSDTSTMLKEVVKTLGMGGQKKEITIQMLEKYER